MIIVLPYKVEVVAIDEREHTWLRKALDAGLDHAPDLQRLAILGHDVWIGRVARLEFENTIGLV